MHERFAVVFRDGSAQAAGALEVEPDRLRLRGRANEARLELEIPFSELSEVRLGRRPHERLNGYRTLVLERAGMPAVQVAPLGAAMIHEIVDLLVSLGQRTDRDVLVVVVALKGGCLHRVRALLAKGPPFDPASLGLSRHEVYLREREAVFVFCGNDVRTPVATAIRDPAVWKAGLAWQRCFAAPPRIVEAAEVSLDDVPAYRWHQHDQQSQA